MENENAGQSSGSTSSSTPDDVKRQGDDLAKDLLAILDKHGVAAKLGQEQLKNVLVDLSIYLVNRDHRILQHGIAVGKEQ